jgi:transposase, IS5 family
VLQAAKVRLNQRNRTINKTRARVKHVFASLAQQGGKCVRAMTLARNALAITCSARRTTRAGWYGWSRAQVRLHGPLEG